MRGIDTDNFDGDIPVAHFEMLRRDYDVRFNIIGLEAQMPFAARQRQASEAAGLVVPLTYKFLYWTDNDLERMKQAAGFGLPVAIDCEYGNGMAGNAGATVERIAQARELLIREGRYFGIYSGAWWWPQNTGNSEAFKDDPLWNAGYPFNRPGQPPVLPPASYMPTDFRVDYGGWKWAAIWQYADVCYGDEAGPWALDLNAWNPAFSGPGAAGPQEDRMHSQPHLANPPFFYNLTVGERIAVWTTSPLENDLHVPPEAKSVEFCVYSTAGGLDLLHGDGQKAGYCPPGVHHYRVYLAADEHRTFGLEGVSAGIVDKIEVLGWYEE